MKFNKTINEGLFKTKEEKQIAQIEKKYRQPLESLKKLNDPYYYQLKQKMTDEIEALKPQKERDWSSDEIDQWLDLDDRKLKSQIQFGGVIEPMDPLEIRARHVYKSMDMFGPEDSFERIKNELIKEYGKEAWDLAVIRHNVPSTAEEWKSMWEEA